MPVNIALFAPWGSGKSSLFTLIAASLEGRERGTKLIRYDAWRYGGKALRRNFIAHAARELRLPEGDPRYSAFHRGLYQNQRRVSISAPRFWREVVRGPLAPLLLFGLIALAIGLVFSVDSILIGAMVSTLVVVLAATIEAGKVEIEQSRPSEDEEFSARFSRLIELVTDSQAAAVGRRHSIGLALRRRLSQIAEWTQLYRLRLWWSGWLPPRSLNRRDLPCYQRLIFFIDELDRCSAQDIAETLKALRTFLDAKNCVFVVAADRDVIEAALPKAEQTTPINQEKPYYTSAGAYLDKIFQHQLTLPPLRSRSLAKFARNLTTEAKDGIWQELAELNGGGESEATPELDTVLFTLIPSHVYSPRRIKVLLNNYATNVRIVRSRLPAAWPARRREIARLTAFQTEFPDFAEDLPLEPRLPRFLLELSRDSATEIPDSEQLMALLNRWRLPTAVVEADGAEHTEGEGSGEGGATTLDSAPESGLQAEPDELLTEDAVAKDPEHRKAEREARRKTNLRRRQELRRYLERTQEVVQDLGRDLFYLRSAGVDVGLEDPVLAELIETEATDSPVVVIEALVGRPAVQLEGAARLLASMVGDVLGPEQRGVMSCLMAAVVELGDDLTPYLAREVAPALYTYWNANQLQEEHLLGALRTALAARSFDQDLINRVIRDPRIFDDPDRVTSIVMMAPRLSDTEVALLRSGIATRLGDGYRPLTDAISDLPAHQQLRVMDSDEVFAAIDSILAAEEEAAQENLTEEGEPGG